MRDRVSFLARMAGVGTGEMVWRRMRAGQELPSPRWFGRRFLEAATVVVDRWGPVWARKRVLGEVALGAWLLLVLWIGVPVVLLRVLW